MTNEHVLVFETEQAIPITVSSSSAFEKGAMVKLADPFTVSASLGIDDVVGGIVKIEKTATDGKIKLAIYRRGIFKGTASGNITAGDSLGSANQADGLNQLYNNKVTANLSGNVVWGIALETCTDGETFLYELNPQCLTTA